MSIADDFASDLPLHRVHVVERGQRVRPGWLPCRIDDQVRFDTRLLETYCVADGNPLVYDSLLLVAAVQFCDHTKARPSDLWGRNIHLCIPVHDPQHWIEVSGLLKAALCFLTGDRWDISFTARKQRPSRLSQTRLQLPNSSQAVMPYSDGMDSCVVAKLLAKRHRNRPVLVRLGTLPDRDRKAVHFAAVPYKVRYDRSRESSSRSRAFKFAVLSGIAAFLTEADAIIMPESGQGVLGPVLVPVGQAYPDYRNHPLFTRRMEAFLEALFGHKIRFEFPRIWQTKSETLREFVSIGGSLTSLIKTRSCWQSQRTASVDGKRRQCGMCAACLLRRMSVHAANISEPINTYVWEELSAHNFEDGAAPGYRIRKANGAQYDYAIAAVLHLDHLAYLIDDATESATIGHHAFLLSRSLGLPQDEVRARLERLLKQHQREWKNFVHSLGPQSFVAQWATGAR